MNTLKRCLLPKWTVYLMLVAIVPQAALGQDGLNAIGQDLGQLQEEDPTPVASATSETTMQLEPVILNSEVVATSTSTLLSADESRRLTTAITKAEEAEVKLSEKIESCWVRMHNMRATITEIKEIQVDVSTVVYELRDRQGKLLGRVHKVNDQLDRIDGELGYLVDDLMAAAEQMGLLNQNLNLLSGEVGELNCMLKQLGCNLQQL